MVAVCVLFWFSGVKLSAEIRNLLYVSLCLSGVCARVRVCVHAQA